MRPLTACSAGGRLALASRPASTCLRVAPLRGSPVWGEVTGKQSRADHSSSIEENSKHRYAKSRGGRHASNAHKGVGGVPRKRTRAQGVGATRKDGNKSANEGWGAKGPRGCCAGKRVRLGWGVVGATHGGRGGWGAKWRVCRSNRGIRKGGREGARVRVAGSAAPAPRAGARGPCQEAWVWSGGAQQRNPGWGGVRGHEARTCEGLQGGCPRESGKKQCELKQGGVPGTPRSWGRGRSLGGCWLGGGHAVGGVRQTGRGTEQRNLHASDGLDGLDSGRT